MMKIEPYDHILRFRFVSETRPDIAHLVDLGAYDGFGECSCEDFCYRVRPGLVANRSRATLATAITDEGAVRRCKHLVAAREYLVDSVICRVTDGERGLA